MHDKENTAKVKLLFDEGNQLRKEGKLTLAIEKYSEALQADPDYLPALNQLTGIYQTRKEFDKAIAHYQRVVELMPKNSQAHTKLARMMMRQRNIPRAIAAYQKAVTLVPEQPAWVYWGLGNALNQNGRIDEAIAAYQKAIDLKPDLFASISTTIYQTLEAAWQKQERLDLDEAIAAYEKSIELKPDNPAVYRLLAKSQARKGDLDGAISSYQKAIELQPDPPVEFRQSVANALLQHEEIYLHIWNTLNQTNLDGFYETKFCYPTDINQELVRQYFTGTSKYRVIDLLALTKEDRLFLEASKLSLANFRLGKNNNAKTEESHLKSFNHNVKILPQELSVNSQIPIRKDLLFQESMVETGYLYEVCPISGRTLRSNQSFLLAGQLAFYRFVGDEVFYTITDGPWFEKHCFYFPKLELIVRFGNSPRITEQTFNEWKALAVAYWQEVISNIVYKGEREVVLTLGWQENIAHHLLNDLTGMQRLSKTGRLKKVDKILVGTEYFFKIEEIFPEISADKVIRISDRDRSNLPKIVLDNKYFSLHAGEVFITEELAQRIYQLSVEHCHPSFLSKLEKAKKHFPLLWLDIRLHNRQWESQREGYASIVNKLAKDFPNLGIVFDGFSLADKQLDRNQVLLGKIETNIENQRNFVKEILALIPDKNKVGVYNNIGCMTYESIVWAHAVDFYIAHWGAGLTKVTFLANKPGIVHTHRNGLTATPIRRRFYCYERENLVVPTFLSADYVVNIHKPGVKPMSTSYHCDWKAIYNEVIKLMSTLTKK